MNRWSQLTLTRRARAMSGDAIAEMIQRRAASAGFTDAQVDRSTRQQTGTYAPFN